MFYKMQREQEEKITLSGEVGGRCIMRAWSGCKSFLCFCCSCLSDGVGLLLDGCCCFKLLELVTIIGWFDCAFIGDGDAWTDSIPESWPCSTVNDARRHMFTANDVDGDSINVVSSLCCFIYKKATWDKDVYCD